MNEEDFAMDEVLRLGSDGWTWSGEGFTMEQTQHFLTYLINNNYTLNGGKVKRQIQGMPMGMPAAPQIANLACYLVEKKHAYFLGPGHSFAI